MIRVLILHPGVIPHYRIPLYNYLSIYLKQYGFELRVMSDGIHLDGMEAREFQHIKTHLSALSIGRYIKRNKIEVIIDFMELKHWYLFPTYIIAKGILRRKMIYWGQGCDLLDANAKMKNLAYSSQQALCDAIILYAEHLKKYLPERFHKRIFIANNTLHINYKGLPEHVTRKDILAEYGIKTKKNIICIGRMHKRKRLDHLLEAFIYMDRSDIGIILVGPDPDGILDKFEQPNIFNLDSLYGDKKFDLLSSADVYCLPGAVGLGIVDAFFCGLPFVTEEGDESAEIMYLKNGVNGFIVPRGNISALSQKLLLLLDDDELRKKFSNAAKEEIKENGSMEMFCSGFRKALFYAIGQSDRKYEYLEKGNS